MRWGILIIVISRLDVVLLVMRSISFFFIFMYVVIGRKFFIGNVKRVRMSIVMVILIGIILMIYILDEGCCCCF